MSTPRTSSVVLQAGYLTHGFISARSNSLGEPGEVETVETIMVFVPYVEAVVAQAISSGYEFPGVFEYEVTQEIGSWLNGRLPLSSQEFAQKLLDLSRNFFRTQCDELRDTLDKLLGDEAKPSIARAFGDHSFALVRAEDGSEGVAQLGLVRNDFVICDAKMSSCGRCFVDSMHEYQITYQQRDHLESLNTLLSALAQNCVDALASTTTGDVFDLQKKVLSHQDWKSQFSNAIGACLLDIIESEKA